MMKYLPDTNVWSRYMRNRVEDLPLRRQLGARLRQCFFSAVVLTELEYGAEKRPDLPVLRERLRSVRQLFETVLPLDEEAAISAGRLRAFLATLKPNALPIGPYDLLLAGQALSLGAVFVTANTTEFSRVPGLHLENWQA
jgi:tRNA(fMet)-specific endonuclease VapC